ncbi:MAG: cell surface protein SprA, partial [Bacteroidetes bacterium]|nr:cell surface protein SprA [Bacteroidota bacterium]
RFIRMYLTGFADSFPVVCRFAEFQLIRDSWRSFSYVLDTTGNYTTLPNPDPTTFNVTAVNIEQNSSRSPVPYVIPPGILRQQQLSTNNTNLLLNEQSLSIQLCNLQPGDARGVYKTVNLDLRRYGKLDMFIHAEAAGSESNLNDNELYAIIRLGSDFISNFYEIKIPLKKTSWGTTSDVSIWPDTNNLNLTLSRLTQLKTNRNNAVPSNQYYTETDPNGKVYAIIGNPNLGQVQAFFLGVRNVSTRAVCSEIWFDELRLSNINDKGGWAALGRVDLKLADLGTVYVSGSYKSVGFGSIDQHINERSFNDVTQFDAAANMELGKLLPKKIGISIPTYASISKTTSSPLYDPFDLDIALKDKINNAPASLRDSIREQAIDASTIKTLNFTNVRKLNTNGKRPKLWSLQNFDFSYSYTQMEHHNEVAVEDELKAYKGGLGYNYTVAPKSWEPFKRKIKSKSPWLGLIRDFNINPFPNTLKFNADVDRQFGAYRSRNIGGPKYFLPETFNKFFNFRRSYVFQWNLTKSLSLDFSAINNSVVDEDSGRLNSASKRKMWSNFLKGGRNLLYQQTANVGYVLPTNKFPALDWTNIHVGYSATYTWIAASLLAKSLGNTLQNTQTKSITGEFDFTRLYSKWKWLRALDAQPGKQQPNQDRAIQGMPKNKADTAGNKKQKIKDPNELPEINGILKVLGRIITSVKRVSVNYAENSASNIYGYTDSTRALGMDLRNGEPGLAYIFGKQPDANFVNRLARKGLITTDSTLNFQNQQSYNQKLNIRAQLQPFRDFNVDVNFDKTFGKTFTELFKDTTSTSGFVHLSPYNTGTFSISFIAMKTLFQKNRPDELSKAFINFENYRTAVSQRLGKSNPYSGTSGADGYYKGYGRYAQDVLIPAFIAAYTGKDPNKIALVNENNSSVKTNPFSGYFPKPNWRISYNGLSRVPGMDKIFSSFNLTHAYNSTLSMSSFNTSLLYQDPLGIRYPGFIDTVSGNFIPYFAIPNITIIESFSPLLNVDMTFVNQLQVRVGYNKSRQLSLSLIDYQMTENHSTEFTFGGGWRKRGLPLPFHLKIKMPGKSEASGKLDNDLNFRLDFSIRDDITANSRLDQGTALPTGGQRTITISPSIDYVMSNRINLKLYFDQRRVTPKISTSPPIVTTRAGLQLRISLAP